MCSISCVYNDLSQDLRKSNAMSNGMDLCVCSSFVGPKPVFYSAYTLDMYRRDLIQSTGKWLLARRAINKVEITSVGVEPENLTEIDAGFYTVPIY